MIDLPEPISRGRTDEANPQTPIASHTHNGIDSPLLSAYAARALQMIVFNFTSDVAVGDGKFYAHIDQRLTGKGLSDVHAKVITAGTTNVTSIQIANVTKAVDMLSTNLTIDSGETDSSTALTPAEINQANKGVTLNDIIRIDIDGVSVTAPKGLIVTLGFA